eukprot:g335.t1
MTEYWKSNAKHYCKFCSCWVQGDKASIRHHENGARHKQNVEEYLKRKREKKQEQEEQSSDVAQQLREIEQAAHAQHAVDMRARGGGGGTSSAAPWGGPPPPHFARGLPPGSARRGDGGGAAAGTRDKEDDDKQASTGEYTVRGVRYLEGDHADHTAKLVSGTACQVFDSRDDEWHDARIEAVTELPIPHTQIVVRKYMVTLVPPSAKAAGRAGGACEAGGGGDVAADAAPPGRGRRMEVRAGSIRLVCPPALGAQGGMGHTATVEECWNAAQKAGQAAVPVDEATGIGGWATVAVTVVDEAEEAAAAAAKAEEERRDAMRAQAAAQAVEQKRQQDILFEQDDGADDVSAAFNPWGGTYKGVKLEADPAQGDAAQAAAPAGPVVFKFKKRKMMAKGKLRKKLRSL